MILSAGAVGSPHILQLSGVGDPEHLARIGVPVVHESRGVGRNIQDHYTARVSYPVVEETPGLSAGAWQMRPLSRGYVEAKSNRPGDMPAINRRYLSKEPDHRTIIGGLRMARRLFAAPRIAAFYRARDEA